jgi:hypothetical protein
MSIHRFMNVTEIVLKFTDLFFKTRDLSVASGVGLLIGRGTLRRSREDAAREDHREDNQDEVDSGSDTSSETIACEHCFSNYFANLAFAENHSGLLLKHS